MDLETIDRTLALLTLDEVAEALWFIDVCERNGNMDQTEADEWRKRIDARRRFRSLIH